MNLAALFLLAAIIVQIVSFLFRKDAKCPKVSMATRWLVPSVIFVNITTETLD